MKTTTTTTTTTTTLRRGNNVTVNIDVGANFILILTIFIDDIILIYNL